MFKMVCDFFLGKKLYSRRIIKKLQYKIWYQSDNFFGDNIKIKSLKCKIKGYSIKSL